MLQTTKKIQSVIEYQKTKKGIITLIYAAQKTSSKKRGHASPEYSKEWFSCWLLEKNYFHYLFKLWVNSGYLKDLKPSVDRIDDSIGYVKTNIRLTTWKGNLEKYRRDIRLGNRTPKLRPHVPVRKYTKDGMYVEEYISVNSAARDNDIHASNITKCCRGKLLSTGGFRWSYL